MARQLLVMLVNFSAKVVNGDGSPTEVNPSSQSPIHVRIPLSLLLTVPISCTGNEANDSS